jgi:ADP-ribose pyrophosphatase YjhB (NUDIX family)
MQTVKSHLGVYAFITNKTGTNLLLIKKARGPYEGLYDLPGGTIEPEELLEETLVREIKEETGCSVISYWQIITLSTKVEWNRKKEGKEDVLFKHIGILYGATVDGEPSTEGDGLDSNGAVWLPIDDIISQKIKTSPFVLKGLSYVKR